MKYSKGKKRDNGKNSDVAELVKIKDSFNFFKYGTLIDDLLNEEEIEDIAGKSKGKKDDAGDEGQKDEMDNHHHYSHQIYGKSDLYKDDMKQYDLTAIDKGFSMGKVHQIAVHTQDPHLRRMVLKEKMF